ncbi:MAG: flagellar export chaperone FliS [Acidobacteriota bacterium]
MLSTYSNTYQQIEVVTASQLQLVVMLYEGAIRFLGTAQEAIRTRDLIGKNAGTDRALAIIGELQSTLKIEEGGEIAATLDKLYSYMNERILEASAKLDVTPLDEVIKLLRILLSAWNEIAGKAEARPESVEAQSVPALADKSLSAGQPRGLEVFG